MQKTPINRRGFLRLCVVAAGSLVATACQKAIEDIATATEAIATSTASASSSVKLNLAGGARDVWAWVKQVKVQVSEGQCEKVVVRVDDQEFNAQPDGEYFSAEVKLSEGKNQVSAACLPPGGAETSSDSAIFIGRLREAPTAVIEIAFEGGQIGFDGSKSLPAEDNAAMIRYFWSARPTNPALLRLPDGELTGEVDSQKISITPPTIDGEYYVSLRVVDQFAREDISTIYFVVESGQARIPDYDVENPAWVENSVVYGVVPFLFGSPAFRAISERLDDLADLGINALWLAPINVHPAEDYGYAVEDYFGLDPAYGTKQDFRSLVHAAHARDIKILMDFVPNHTSNTHPYFKSAEAGGPGSPYWDFYDRDEGGNPTHYFDWEHLPNLNYEHPEVRQMMIEAFTYWVREFDIDGFRVDAAWAIKERRPDFWLEWRHALKRVKPDLFLLAEAGARDLYYFDNGFDAAYDWTAQVGAWAWRIAWDAYKYRLLSYNLTDALTNRPEGFHRDALIFRFLNNNDTGKRFITRHGEGITKVATAFLLTLPGIPCIYTGDEYGLGFEPYQELTPLTFEEQYPGMRAYHQKLIALRKSLPSLHSRLFSIIKPDAVPQTVFSYIRYTDGEDAPVIVLLNFSEQAAEFEFDLPKDFGALSRRSTLYDLLTDEEVPASAEGRMHVSVPGLTARVLSTQSVE